MRFSLLQTAIVNAVRSVICCASDESSGRFTLNGIRFEFDGESLEVIATDGRRLAYRKVACDRSEKSCFTLDLRTCRAIAALPTSSNVRATLVVDGDRVTVDARKGRYGNKPVEIVGLALEGRYPNWRQIAFDESCVIAGLVGSEKEVRNLFAPVATKVSLNGDLLRSGAAQRYRVLKSVDASECRRRGSLSYWGDCEIIVDSDLVSPYVADCDKSRIEVEFATDKPVRFKRHENEFLVVAQMGERD